MSVDFAYLQDSLSHDQSIREKIKDQSKLIDQAQRPLVALLSRVHSTAAGDLPGLLSSLDPLLEPLQSSLRELAVLVPKDQFYRYNDLFSRQVQQSSYIVVLRRFLESECQVVVSKEEVAKALAMQEEWRDHFFLSTEDYLHSLISLVNELSRLAINRVTMGDYAAPVQYSKFAKELSNAFGLLNLKNDSLRKRFDSIKYDVKRLEEVVYDLSLRGLLPSASLTTTTTATAATTELAEERENKRARVD
ncbi:hypothetical protein JCM3766R1_001421 [Sporobolomyces carnicolor]